jgi:hypothetical protein
VNGNEGAQPTIGDISGRTAEFRLLPLGDEVAADVQWQSFLARFERSATEVGFAKVIATRLMSAFAEMCENSVIHSRSQLTPLAGYVVSDGTAQFTVVDVGIGVKASLAQNPLYVDLANDVDAIERAMHTGVTSQQGSGGFGFQSVFKALAEQWGQLRFRSGNGCISLDGTDIDVDKCRRSRPLPLLGFQVSVCCRADKSYPGTGAF